MIERLTLDRLEELLEALEPSEIRSRFANQLTSECERMLAEFEGLDQELRLLTQDAPQANVEKPQRRLGPWALSIAAVLVLGLILWSPDFNGSLAPDVQTQPPAVPHAVPTRAPDEEDDDLVSGSVAVDQLDEEVRSEAERPKKEELKPTAKVMEETRPLRQSKPSASPAAPEQRRSQSLEPQAAKSVAVVEDREYESQPEAVKNAAQSRARDVPKSLREHSEEEAMPKRDLAAGLTDAGSQPVTDQAFSSVTWIEVLLVRTKLRNADSIRELFATQATIHWPALSDASDRFGWSLDLTRPQLLIVDFRAEMRDGSAWVSLTSEREGQRQTQSFRVDVSLDEKGLCTYLNAQAVDVVR